jgi:lipopolysaccharide transport system ATP-binding protein
MGERRWNVGICGTFDVANYGDLLFPLIAESELTKRLGAVTLHRFSYNARTPPEWPYEVTSVTKLPEMIDRLDGLLIGGGFLIRFDKYVAPGYVPPTPEIHHPTGYWLTPALIALQHNVPLVWNAPGMHCNEIPAWAQPLIERALTLSRYVSVRDEPSRASLESLTNSAIAVVPDTAFGLPGMLHLERAPSDEFTRLSQACGLEAPYIVLQANLGLEGVIGIIKSHAEHFRNFHFLALPISPGLTDRAEIIDADLPGVARLGEWPNPLVVAELIGRAEAVFGHSYHLCITALSSGVPVFTRLNLSTGKYTALQHFETIHALPPDGGKPDLEWMLARVGRITPSDAARAAQEALGNHWDRIAAVLRAGPARTAPMLNRFWQSLPAVLESLAGREDESVAQERAEIQARLDDLLKLLTRAGHA